MRFYATGWYVAAVGLTSRSGAAPNGRHGWPWYEQVDAIGGTVSVGRQPDALTRLQVSTEARKGRRDVGDRKDNSFGSTKRSTRRTQLRAQWRRQSRRRSPQATPHHRTARAKIATMNDTVTQSPQPVNRYIFSRDVTSSKGLRRTALFRQRPDVVQVETLEGTRYRMVAQLKPKALQDSTVLQRRCNLPHATPQRVRAHIIGTCDRARDVHLHRAIANWCGVDGLNCSVYLDGNCHHELHARLLDVGTSPGQWLLDLVTPSEYLPFDEYPPRHECCNQSVRFVQGSPRRPSSSLSTWDGMGPSTYFCGAKNHRKKTRPHQMRFLYALAHERRTHGQRFRSLDLDWLVQLDDDSAVSLPRLMQVLCSFTPPGHELQSLARCEDDLIPP